MNSYPNMLCELAEQELHRLEVEGREEELEQHIEERSKMSKRGIQPAGVTTKSVPVETPRCAP